MTRTLSRYIEVDNELLRSHQESSRLINDVQECGFTVKKNDPFLSGRN